VLSGPPLLLFAVFTITVFIVSLVSALLIGVIAALLFTVFMVLVALFVVLPTVFLTTMGATFIFLWGIGGYYIFKWFNDGTSPAAVGNAVGDKLNTLTGGKLGWLMESARGKVESAGVEVPGKDSLEHVPLTKSEESQENGISGESLSGETTGGKGVLGASPL
jgi:Promethin